MASRTQCETGLRDQHHSFQYFKNSFIKMTPSALGVGGIMNASVGKTNNKTLSQIRDLQQIFNLKIIRDT